MPVTIKDVKVIMTAPHKRGADKGGSSPYHNIRLVIVKVITSEPGLYGLGCATFTQGCFAVKAALEHHVIPFIKGREVNRIEELYQMMTVHSYWRNGPVMNNAISGVDQALWDIKGKLANMPLYELLGGKVREAAACYVHGGGDTPEACLESVSALKEEGYQHIRIQMGGYGGKAQRLHKPEGALDGAYYHPREFVNRHLKMFEMVRAALGYDLELLHDVHERLKPIDAIQYAEALNPMRLFFLEDLLAPEDNEWFSQVRQHCTLPLAMGELFNNPDEWMPLIEKRQIDFLRMHVSQMGGITPARHVASLAHAFSIKTAWHGPGDTSPVGHAANLHLDLWAPNFGIQEWCQFDEIFYEMFPGLPQVRQGYMYPNDQPGLGIDIDEALAAKFPCDPSYVEGWTQTRLPDGSPARP